MTDMTNAADILNKIEALRPTYLPQWRPYDGDAGWAIAQIFSKMLEELGGELDRVPQKLFAAYLDALGFTQAPPLSATAPVTFVLTANFNGSLTIPAKTELSTKEKISYETDNAFCAASAKLCALYCADSVNNLVSNFSDALSWKESIELFNAKGEQQIIYFGDDDLFNIHRVQGDNNAYLEYIVPSFPYISWEYWGQKDKNTDAEWITFDAMGDDLNKKEIYTTVKREINGIRSYWIRAKTQQGTQHVPSYALSYKSRSGIDALYCNDVSLNPAKQIYPFGYTPQKNDTFYFASGEAFSKRGFTIGIAIDDLSVSVINDGNAKLGSGIISFEYHNGSSWKPLSITGYPSSNGWAEKVCDICFIIPADMAQTSVNGDTNYWVRCKLVGGSYGTYKCEDNNLKADFDPPVIRNLDIYVKAKSKIPEYVFRFAHQRFTDLLAPMDTAPYTWIDEMQRTLYLGFDTPFGEGLISMLVSVDKSSALKERQLQWHCYVEEGWTRLNVKDTGNGLIKSGLCTFIAPSRQAKSEHFGRELYWLKILFSDNAEKIILKGIHLNTVMATQCKTVENELLGSSDGSASQSFMLKQPPVIDLALWVLEPNPPEGGRCQTDKFGEGYWVEWSVTEGFEGRCGNERLYVLDANSGEIKFGDGKRGMIPPMHKSGIIATYRTGGGSKGNTEAGSITKMANSIAYVEKVTNPESATGGADKQSLEMMMKQAPKRMKHGYRAVTSDDYSALALEASSDVAKVKAISGKGRVDVLIIPYSNESKPLPSVGLIEGVKEYIQLRAPVTAEVNIIAPNFSRVSVDVEVVISNWSMASALTSTLQEQLAAFLHPIKGGLNGRGWEFGSMPVLSDFLILITAFEGVSYIKKIELIVNDSAGDHVYGINSGESKMIDSNSMVCSGEHTINIKGE